MGSTTNDVNVVKKLMDVTVVNSFLIRRLIVLDQYCVADSLNFFSRLKILIKSLFFQRRTLECANWVLDNWSSGYYHWFNDVLPRCIQVLANNQTQSVLLPERFLKLHYVTDSLTLLGCTYLTYRDDECVLIKSLYLPKAFKSGDLPASLLQHISGLFRMHINSKSSQGCGVYISRKGALRRRIINEREVTLFLAEYDFKIVEMETLSFQEQYELMRSTRVLISNHGAGLTNMLFMDDLAIVIEFAAGSPIQNNCFAEMAKKLNKRYIKIESEFDGPDFQKANLIVDVNKLNVILKSHCII